MTENNSPHREGNIENNNKNDRSRACSSFSETRRTRSLGREVGRSLQCNSSTRTARIVGIREKGKKPGAQFNGRTRQTHLRFRGNIPKKSRNTYTSSQGPEAGGLEIKYRVRGS
mmetsp:Transcript_14065/g.26547  ORF Transcript_14065/g.26547 Transcript_14065/m.26547 type:complete len:114 (+) Transcript_14065:1772-2113(+)